MLRWLLAKLKRPAPTDATSGFLDTVTREARRSLRYNHFFSVAVVSCPGTRPEELRRRLERHLRSTDTLAGISGLGAGRAVGGDTYRPGPTLPAARDAPERMAALLPETDGTGAAKAMQRLRSALSYAGDLRVGLAVYPDDATDPAQLLRLADLASRSEPSRAGAVGGDRHQR